MITVEKSHAKYGASKSERWLNCAGSVALEAKAPPQAESPYALEGTRAHECLEAFLKSPNDILGTRKKLLKKYPEDMVKHADWAAQVIYDLHAQASNAVLLSETKVKLDFVEPGEYGTVDAGLVEEFGTLYVIDYKYGAGIAVDPESNTQMIYYALGLAHKYGYNFEKVVLSIIQPRADHPKGPVRSHEMTMESLKNYTEIFKKGIARAKKPNATLFDGPWCKFCKAAVICPRVSKKSLVEAKIVFAPEKDELVLPDAKSVAIPYLGNVLTACEKIEFWIAEVRAHAHHVLSNGEKAEGWKLVDKRSTRKWLDPEKVEKEAKKKFGDKAFVTELLSPAQLEKAVKDKDWVEKRVSSISSGTTIAPESDPRPAVDSLKKIFGGQDDNRSGSETGNSKTSNSSSRKNDKRGHTPRRADSSLR